MGPKTFGLTVIDRLSTVDTRSLDLTVDIPHPYISCCYITLSYIHCLSTLVCIDSTVHLCVQYLTFGSTAYMGLLVYLLLNGSHVSRPLPAPAFAASMISQKLELEKT